jgi:hypothetical protein
MFEVLIAALITLVVFALFILAFLIRKRPPGKPVHVHRCARCDCERKNSHPLPVHGPMPDTGRREESDPAASIRPGNCTNPSHRSGCSN